MKNIAIVIGDNLYNTFGLVRSLGRCKAEFYLLCASSISGCSIAKSRYIKKGRYFRFADYNQLSDILNNLKRVEGNKYIICSFDSAAEWVDRNEERLCKDFITPCRGKQIGTLFDKNEQCELAVECGLDVPKSFIYRDGDTVDYDGFPYPVFTKPLISSEGHKQDQHICSTPQELKAVIENSVTTKSFIIQEYIEKDFEINCLGVRTDKECVVAGAIRKFRFFPDTYGACAYGKFEKVDIFNINTLVVEKFLEKSGYFGPFSIEFIHKNGKNYFMEVNFRNDGLAYAATCGGFNLYNSYINCQDVSFSSFKSVHIMNVYLDFCYGRYTGKISLIKWLYQFISAECHLDFSIMDPMPLFWRPIAFVLRRLPFNTERFLD